MWFVADLLLFTLAYVAWRAWRGAPRTRLDPAVPGHRALVVYVLALGLVTALVRVRYPVDRWVTWLVPSELAHLPQYLTLFALGIVASHGAWFDRLPRRTGLAWFAVGVAGSLAFLVAVALRWPNPLIAMGGWKLGNPIWSLWEACICVGFSVGLVVAFRELVRRPSARVARFAENSYAVYIVHVPIVVALQSALLRCSLPLAAKFLLATGMGIALSFGLAALLRRSAIVRRVL